MKKILPPKKRARERKEYFIHIQKITFIYKNGRKTESLVNFVVFCCQSRNQEKERERDGREKKVGLVICLLI